MACRATITRVGSWRARVSGSTDVRAYLDHLRKLRFPTPFWSKWLRFPTSGGGVWWACGGLRSRAVSNGCCNTDGFKEESRLRTSSRESAIGGRGACSQPGGGATSSSSFRAQASPRRRAGDCCALRVASLCHAAERGRGEHAGPGVERWGGEGTARKKRRRPLMRGRRLAVLGCARTPAFQEAGSAFGAPWLVRSRTACCGGALRRGRRGRRRGRCPRRPRRGRRSGRGRSPPCPRR